MGVSSSCGICLTKNSEAKKNFMQFFNVDFFPKCFFMLSKEKLLIRLKMQKKKMCVNIQAFDRSIVALYTFVLNDPLTLFRQSLGKSNWHSSGHKIGTISVYLRKNMAFKFRFVRCSLSVILK